MREKSYIYAEKMGGIIRISHDVEMSLPNGFKAKLAIWGSWILVIKAEALNTFTRKSVIFIFQHDLKTA